MNKKALVAIAMAVFGLATGPTSLQAAAASRPPIDQFALIFILFALVLGPIFTLGLQAARKDPKPLIYGWYFFAACAIYFLATGLSAAGVALLSGSASPHVFLFLVMGVGISLGLLACRKLFASKFAAGT